MSVKAQCYTNDGNNIAASGTEKASRSTATSNTSSKLSETSRSATRNENGIIDNITDAINSAATSIDSIAKTNNLIDCSDQLSEFLKYNVPSFSSSMSSIDSINGSSFGVGFSVGSLMSMNDFGKTICTFVEKWFGMLNGMLDIGLKSALVMLKRIDAALERLDNATLAFTDSIKSCVLDVLDTVNTELNLSMSVSVDINWDSIIEMMAACPCITKIIANMTGCTESNGIDISSDPGLVIQSIKDKGIFQNPTELSGSINNMVSKFTKKYLKLILGYLETWIEYVFQYLIKPLRKLMKMYVKLLTKKVNVNDFLKNVGSYNCFFSYTEEYDNGKKYYGMSFIDILKTFKTWVGCLSGICPSLSEKIKNATKERYKEFRLDEQYWKQAQEADIYLTCIASELDTSTTKETTLRKLYSGSSWDLLLSLFKRAKNKDESSSESEEDAENFDLSQPMTVNTSDIREPSAISQAVAFTSSPETENDIQSGTKPITDREENALEKIATTLNSHEGDPFYTEHFYQLIRFGNAYATSQAYLDYMRAELDKNERITGDFSKSSDSSFVVGTNRIPDFADNPMGHPTVDNPDVDSTVEPTYEISSDYDQYRYNKISRYSFVKQNAGESLADYYARMFRLATA